MIFHPLDEHFRGRVFWIHGTLGKLAGFPSYTLAAAYAYANWGGKWEQHVTIREEVDHG